MRSVCLIGYYGAGNLGDDLLLTQTISLLQKTGDFHFKVFVGDLNLCKLSENINYELINKFSFKQIILALYKSEALIFGGGSVFQDISSIKSLIYYFCICLLSKLMNKKIIFLSQGIGPLKSHLGNILSYFAYKMANSISVRDKYSLNILQKNWKIKAVFAPDLIWSWFSPQRKKKKAIGISLRPFKDLTLNNINSFSEYILEKFINYQIYLFAFQERDLEVLQIIKNKIPQAQLINLQENTEENINYFLEIEYCFAMRFHALILAIKAGIPVMGIIYDIKLKALCEQAKLPYLESINLQKNNLIQTEKQLMPTNNELINFANNQAQAVDEINISLLKEIF